MYNDNIIICLVVNSLASVAPRSSLSDQVANSIVRMIMDGVYRPGDRLPTESELVDQFGVSRTVIREAITKLRVLDICDVRQGDGTYVNNASLSPLTQSIIPIIATKVVDDDQLVVARFYFEPPVFWLCADRVRRGLEISLIEIDKGIEAMSACLRRDNMRDFSASEEQLVQQVAAHCGNALLQGTICVMGQLFAKHRYQANSIPDMAMTSYCTYAQAVKYIKAGDPEASMNSISSFINVVRGELQARGSGS